MAYEVTASRKRPKTFTSLVGQEFVVATLMNALKTRRIAHAYLFSGPRGVGKTSTARILARALNCPDAELLGTEGCFDYDGAEEISRGTAMDVIEIDGASNTSVNDVRAIKDEVLFPPQNSRYKIYIIDEVHMLSNSAFNALLKTIEEPPPYIIFIFATTEIHKVPATIRSRCQQFNFRLIPLEEIMQLLKEACAEIDVQADDEALFWIARESTGSMRDAYTLLDQVAAFSEGNITLEKIKEKLGLLGIDEMNRMAELFAEGDQSAAVEFLDSMFSTGASVEQLVIDLSDYFRSVLFIKQGIQRDGLLGHPRKGFSDKVIQAFTVVQLEKIIEMLLQLYRDIRYSLNTRLELELLVSKLSRIALYFEPQDIVRKIAALREQIVSMPESSPAASQNTIEPAQNSPAQADKSQQAMAEPSPQMQDSAEDPETAETIQEEVAALVQAPQPVEQTSVDADPVSTQGTNSGTGVDSGLWNRLLETLQKERPSLAATISNSRDARMRDGVLVLYFDTDMHAGNAKRDIQVVQQMLEKAAGSFISVEIEKVEAQVVEETEDPDVQMIKKVFRGDLLQ